MTAVPRQCAGQLYQSEGQELVRATAVRTMSAITDRLQLPANTIRNRQFPAYGWEPSFLMDPPLPVYIG